MAVSRARMPASPLENSLIAEEELRQARLEAHVVADERDEREAGALLRQSHVLHHPAPARSQSAGSTVLLPLRLHTAGQLMVDRNPSLVQVDPYDWPACFPGCALREVPQLPCGCRLAESPMTRLAKEGKRIAETGRKNGPISGPEKRPLFLKPSYTTAPVSGPGNGSCFETAFCLFGVRFRVALLHD